MHLNLWACAGPSSLHHIYPFQTAWNLRNIAFFAGLCSPFPAQVSCVFQRLACLLSNVVLSWCWCVWWFLRVQFSCVVVQQSLLVFGQIVGAPIFANGVCAVVNGFPVCGFVVFAHDLSCFGNVWKALFRFLVICHGVGVLNCELFAPKNPHLSQCGPLVWV